MCTCFRCGHDSSIWCSCLYISLQRANMLYCISLCAYMHASISCLCIRTYIARTCFPVYVSTCSYLTSLYTCTHILPLFMSLYTYIHAPIRVPVYLHTCPYSCNCLPTYMPLFVFLHTYIYAPIYVPVYAHTCINVPLYMLLFLVPVYVHTCPDLCPCIRTYILIRHVPVYPYVHISLPLNMSLYTYSSTLLWGSIELATNVEIQHTSL